MKISRVSRLLPFKGRLEAAVDHLMRDGSGLRFDFTSPKGEAALASPDSVAWQVFKNPVSLFVGGITAVLLELGEPRVRTGVWTHTTFRKDPMRRLKRTGFAAMITVYGPRSQAEAMIAGVGRRHARISGVTPEGRPYRADDPDLLVWVHATANFGFLKAFTTYVRPLDLADRNRFHAEGVKAARLYGALGSPTSEAELTALFSAMQDDLNSSEIVFEFLEIMRRVPVMPRFTGPLQGMLVKAAVEILPDWARDRLHLGGNWTLRPDERWLVRKAGAAAERIVLDGSPAVQACRRLGLPPDYLYP